MSATSTTGAAIETVVAVDALASQDIAVTPATSGAGNDRGP